MKAYCNQTCKQIDIKKSERERVRFWKPTKKKKEFEGIKWSHQGEENRKKTRDNETAQWKKPKQKEEKNWEAMEAHLLEDKRKESYFVLDYIN